MTLLSSSSLPLLRSLARSLKVLPVITRLFSEFQGKHHRYFQDGTGIYRSTSGHGDQEIVEVFNADWEEGYGFIQRVRLSPNETLLAALVKRDHCEGTRCLLIPLNVAGNQKKAPLALDNVLSFAHRRDFVVYVFSGFISPTLVYKQPLFFVEVSRSRDQKLITINCSSKTSSEVWCVPSKSPLSVPVLIQCRQPGLLYYVEHSENVLFILANTGPNQEYQLLKAYLASPSMAYWVPAFRADPGTVIKDMELLQDHCVFTVKDSQCGLQIQSLTAHEPFQLHTLQLPAWACDLSPEHGRTVDSESFRFLLSSPVHPPVGYVYSAREQALSKSEENELISLPEFNTTRLQAASQV
ncbi:hypothetical protein DNTS_013254 [Danionella cerebrum]|uniref:Peptidase S9A N-terminal domain-containing protein n=1 Tax=Danionella cerebrum TaxID=2873325 RepID=A0A553Q705_9TELE|nr:hypothetical protein DNTS_013254 [Danionella translucida]